MTHRATVASIVEPLLTYKQAGDLLGVTDRTVWKLVDLGQLLAVRVGRLVRIDRRGPATLLQDDDDNVDLLATTGGRTIMVDTARSLSI